MKHHFFILLLLMWAYTVNGASQKSVTVRSFSLQAMDHISGNDRRNDLNNIPCALIKVQVVDDIVRVEGNKIGDIINRGVEKWIYMCKGSRNIRVHFKNHTPIKIDFRKYKINSLESNRVYELILDAPNTPLANNTSQKGSLQMKVSPSYTKVSIWGDNFSKQVYQPQEDGYIRIELPYGRYNYSATADDYNDENGHFDIVIKNQDKDIKLEQIKCTLIVEGLIKKADIYINEEKIDGYQNTKHWKGTVLPGNYTITAKKKSTIVYKETISIKAGDKPVIVKLDDYQQQASQQNKNQSNGNLFKMKKVVKGLVDYSVVKVDQEAHLELEQITTDNDYVCMPIVNRSRSQLNWLSNKILDVSADGNKLAFLSARNNTTNIYIKDLISHRETEQRTDRQAILDFNYSPDGKYICFSETSEKGGLNRIFQTSSSNGFVCLQITDNYKDFSPVYSSDLNNIFFTRYYNNRYDIWGYNTITKSFSSYSEGINPYPINNKKIILCSRTNQHGLSEIWEVNYETGFEKRIVSESNRSFTTPTLSPDGKWILLVGNSVLMNGTQQYANTDIFVCSTDGTQLLQLTYHAADDLSPTWSKDGKYIYFISQRGSTTGTANVWRMTFVQ